MQSGWLTSAPTNHLLSTILSILATLVLNGHPVSPAAIRNLLIFPSAIDRISQYALATCCKEYNRFVNLQTVVYKHKTK